MGGVGLLCCAACPLRTAVPSVSLPTRHPPPQSPPDPYPYPQRSYVGTKPRYSVKNLHRFTQRFVDAVSTPAAGRTTVSKVRFCAVSSGSPARSRPCPCLPPTASATHSRRSPTPWTNFFPFSQTSPLPMRVSQTLILSEAGKHKPSGIFGRRRSCRSQSTRPQPCRSDDRANG